MSPDLQLAYRVSSSLPEGKKCSHTASNVGVEVPRRNEVFTSWEVSRKSH